MTADNPDAEPPTKPVAPPTIEEGPRLAQMGRLAAVIARLRAPDGCPWDRKQSTASMAPHLLEEAYEAADALRRGQPDASCEELGDVLVNVLMIAQIASEAVEGDLGGFDLEAIAAVTADKLVRRHPHVFTDQRIDGAEQAYRNWERMKRSEGQEQGPRGVLDGVPAAMPSLLRAYRIGQKAARAGFDWPDRAGPRSKIDEELGELDAAIQAGDDDAIRDELGDLLYSVTNLARHVGIEPETALRGTIDRFQSRFERVEAEFGKDLQNRSLEELEAAWERSKAQESDMRDRRSDDDLPRTVGDSSED
ncbi:MAG: nucleoside triphosphate pyrophosphohydrolase [Planctomycetota bacterium]|nr:nucleoside triphosphate pyrophosphohydrolase [Planctomycetota bacterium]